MDLSVFSVNDSGSLFYDPGIGEDHGKIVQGVKIFKSDYSFWKYRFNLINQYKPPKSVVMAITQCIYFNYK